MTLASIIRSVYRADERKEMRDALRTLFPVDGVDWHQSGLYCFWDPDTQNVLYVGLAKSLERRFAQHNGLSGSSENGNKRSKIDSWFQRRPRLGYSVVAQSAAVAMLEDIGLDSFSEIIALGEGQLIEAHIREFGFRPTWNEISGLTHGAKSTGPLTSGYYRLLTGRTDCLLVARRTIQQLATDPEAIYHEMTLHGGRMYALHQHGASGGVGDHEIAEALTTLLSNPQLSSEAPRHVDLVASGYLTLAAPHPEKI